MTEYVRRLVEITLTKDDGEKKAGDTRVLHVNMKRAATEDEIKDYIEDDYGMDMKELWKVTAIKEV